MRTHTLALAALLALAACADQPTQPLRPQPLEPRPSSHSAPGYTAIEMAMMRGAASVYPSAINRWGKVVGVADYGMPGESGRVQAVVWESPTRVRPLPALNGRWRYSAANGINHRGDIVGATRIEGAGIHAILWRVTGEIVDLGTLPGGKHSVASAINDRGDIVGASEGADGRRHAVLWRAFGRRGPIDLGISPGYSESSARDVNARGEVVGCDRDRRSVRSAGFYWARETGRLPIADSEGAPNCVEAINDRGEAVGTVGPDRERDATFWGFRWTRTDGLQDILSQAADFYFFYDINNRGQITGSENDGFDDLEHAILVEPGAGGYEQIILPPSPNGGLLAAGYTLNDAGNVAGVTDFGDAGWMPVLWARGASPAVLGAPSAQRAPAPEAGASTRARLPSPALRALCTAGPVPMMPKLCDALERQEQAAGLRAPGR